MMLRWWMHACAWTGSASGQPVAAGALEAASLRNLSVNNLEEILGAIAPWHSSEFQAVCITSQDLRE